MQNFCFEIFHFNGLGLIFVVVAQKMQKTVNGEMA
jgi:hypothetical protein